VAIGLCGALFVVSAQSSQGTDLRPGRYDDLAGLVDSEATRAEALVARVTALTAEVDELSAAVQDGRVKRLQQDVAAIKDPAGLVERVGPGVEITLSDAPEEAIDAATVDRNLLIVHQQDIQAVVNALWKGGATAVTIQGRRVISTTGIKCQGSSVLLQGVPYPQPYVISAVGDPGELTTAVADDAYLQIYRSQAEDPTIGIGWALALKDTVTAPAYDGVLTTTYARPLEE
jgi:uncharacterized protein YlxW (UPF0749 family)